MYKFGACKEIPSVTGRLDLLLHSCTTHWHLVIFACFVFFFQAVSHSTEGLRRRSFFFFFSRLDNLKG